MTRRVVHTRTRSVSERATAAVLRESYLETALDEPDPIVCSLNGIEQLSVDAADELVAKFVVRLRAQRPGAVVFVESRTEDVLRKVDAALRERRQAAWGVNEDDPEIWLLLGHVDEDELTALRQFGPDVAQTPALQALAERGLLVATPNGYEAPQFEPAEEEEPVTA
jgi:hypothetical protein